MITVNNTSKAYNGNIVVNIPQLQVRQGEMVGLVGNNGAGKTTFFRLLLDLVRADKGEILSNDHNVATTEDWKRYMKASSSITSRRKNISIL
jgi:ABC-2 type transport system ATP-binding protein